MIEQLFYTYAATPTSPRYQQATEEIVKAEEQLAACLDEEGQRRLAILADAYAKREEITAQDAFTAGFRMAAELADDVQRDQEESASNIII